MPWRASGSGGRPTSISATSGTVAAGRTGAGPVPGSAAAADPPAAAPGLDPPFAETCPQRGTAGPAGAAVPGLAAGGTVAPKTAGQAAIGKCGPIFQQTGTAGRPWRHRGQPRRLPGPACVDRTGPPFRYSRVRSTTGRNTGRAGCRRQQRSGAERLRLGRLPDLLGHPAFHRRPLRHVPGRLHQGIRFSARASTTDGLEKLLDKHKVTWTLLPPDLSAVALLDHLPGWRRVYADKTAVVHARTAQ